jgi:hypothetical protein
MQPPCRPETGYEAAEAVVVSEVSQPAAARQAAEALVAARLIEEAVRVVTAALAI